MYEPDDMDMLDFYGTREMYEYDEYGDPDATSCAEGDYNVWEEDRIMDDMMAGEYDPPEDAFLDMEYEDRFEVEDWAN